VTKVLVAVGSKKNPDPQWHRIVCENYLAWLRSALPHEVVVPVDHTDTHRMEALLDDARGVLFTGGVDIDPALYGAARDPQTENVDSARDRFDAALFDAARERGLPMLCICRGMQMANVRLGGKLLQHIGTLHKRHNDVDASHPISIHPGSHLHALVGGDTTTVNSSHHQAVDPKAIGRGLVVSATARGEQGEPVVEALEPQHPGDGPYLMLVQWHPERIADSPSSRALLRDFVAAVATER
jgi:putative glutamine amidotransferase